MRSILQARRGSDPQGATDCAAVREASEGQRIPASRPLFELHIQGFERSLARCEASPGTVLIHL